MPTKRPRKSPRDRGASILLYTSATLVLISFALAIVLSYPGSRSARTDRPPEVDEASETIAEPSPTDPAPIEAGPSMTDTGPAIAPQRPEPAERPTPRSKGVLVFVIDDAGHNRWQLEPFLSLPGPITIAVLPGLPHTANAVSMVKAAGKELILHQPMEAIGGLDPGPGAIRADMDDETIRGVIRGNLAQVPGAVGVNNHMGSRATSDVRVMSTVLDETAANGLYFLDSLTTGDSVVHSVASLMRQSAWERSVFLDNTPDRASILHYIAEGTKIAEKRGYAVMIGHVWSSELAQTLADLYPQLLEQGFSLSTISRIMMDDDDDDDTGY